MKKGIHSYEAQAKWLNKQLDVELKKIAREKGKAQGVEKSEQAQEVSKKRKGNDEMFFLFLMVEFRNVYVKGNMKG